MGQRGEAKQVVPEQGVVGPEVPIGIEVAILNLVREEKEKSKGTL